MTIETTASTAISISSSTLGYVINSETQSSRLYERKKDDSLN